MGTARVVLVSGVVVVLAALAMRLDGGEEPPGRGHPGNVFADARLFVDPDSEAARAADGTDDPHTEWLLRKVARGATADWFGEETPDAVAGKVSARVDEIRAAGAVPVLVAYNIPRRDCGSHSAGGAQGPREYRDWVQGFADGIGEGPAAVVLEPDALAQMQRSCLSDAEQGERLSLLRYAVNTLTDLADVAVYLDAGHDGWVPAETMGERLVKAGVGKARGFALNVSFFGRTDDEIAYGRDISAAIGNVHFVIDTSRNGRGPGRNRAWCNPSGRALGVLPGTATADPLVDAYLWVKHPGYSDGTCNDGPLAGRWWTSYAVGLASRADW